MLALDRKIKLSPGISPMCLSVEVLARAFNSFIRTQGEPL